MITTAAPEPRDNSHPPVAFWVPSADVLLGVPSVTLLDTEGSFPVPVGISDSFGSSVDSLLSLIVDASVSTELPDGSGSDDDSVPAVDGSGSAVGVITVSVGGCVSISYDVNT